MAWNYSNNSVQTTLSPGIDGVVGSISVGSITGFPVVYPYTLILDYGAANREVVSVTAGVGTTLTVTRGQDGTAAVAHSANAVVVHGVVARDLAEPQAHIPVAQAHIAAGTNVHGLAGGAAVVGTTTAQTLSNKTLDSTSAITVKDNVFTLQDDLDPTKQAQFQLSSIPTASTMRSYTLPSLSVPLVGTTSTQTLTNKTLVSPIITGTRVGVVMRRVANQVIATGPGVTILWDTEDYDSDNFITPTSDTFLIPFDGVYSITAHVDNGGSTGTILQQISMTSGLVGAPSLFRSYTPSGEPFGLISATVRFLAGATFTLVVVHNSGVSKNYTAALQCFRVSV